MLTNERPNRLFIHLGIVFVCVQYHYSVPGQIINVCCSSCFGHWRSGLTGIPGEIIAAFTKQKRVNKETKQKQDESCQESAEEQIRAYLVPPGKEILRHIYICVYVSAVCFLEYDFNISLCSPFFSQFSSLFLFSKEGIFFPQTVFFLPCHLLCCSESKL